jgi:dimethylaniline monooxygenase (N-oxide forming)
MKNSNYFDVIIIGAGWSGLLACKYMKQNNLSAIVLEGRDDIGGIWKYSDDCNIVTVSKNTHTTSSKCLTEMSDYPMPKCFSSFPHHSDICNYLNNYCDNFKLRENIKLGCWVKEVTKSGDNWVVMDDKDNIYNSKYVIVTSGVHSKKTLPKNINLDKFNGKVMHSQQYKKLTSEFDDKNILVIGGGETASDIANEITINANKVYWAIPNGQWFLPKINTISPKGIDNNEPADHHTSALNMYVHPVGKNSGVYFYEDAVEFMWGKCGHGIKEWITDAPYQRHFLNKSSEVLNKVAFGQIIPKRKVKNIKKRNVYFDDGSKQKFDIIILCTGYEVNFPFINEKYRTELTENYKFILNNEYPSLAYIGFVRPVLGSIPAIAEIQSIYVGKLFSKKISLENILARKKTIKKDNKFWRNYFSNTSGRIDTLVNMYIYSEGIAKLSGVNPNYKKLLFKSPLKWWKAITCPYNTSRYLINDEKYHDLIFKNIREYEPHYYNANFIFTYILYFIFYMVRPIYKFVRSFLIGRDNSIIQIDSYEKKYQLMTFLKKLSNVLFIGSIILYIPEIDYYYNKLPLINKLNKNNLIVFILIIGLVILYKSKNIM